MSRPVAPSRPEQQTPWFRRRDTLKAAAAWLAMGGLPAAMAEQRSNLVQLIGDVQLNGQRLLPDQTVQTGDQLQTGPASSVIFVIGDSAFHVRANSRLSLERGQSLTTVSQLRLHAGAVASVWAASGWTVMPNRIGLPPAQFGYLSTQKVSSAGNMSILKYVL